MAQLDKLIKAALEARQKAYAPYSSFCVGAALLSEKGAIFTGSNVENASFALSVCAERVALGSAVAAGERHFKRLVVASDTTPPAVPCGACRQVLMEFSPGLLITAVNLRDEREEFDLKNLLPHAFTYPGAKNQGSE